MILVRHGCDGNHGDGYFATEFLKIHDHRPKKLIPLEAGPDGFIT